MKKDYDSTKIYRKTQKKGASQTYDTPSFLFAFYKMSAGTCTDLYSQERKYLRWATKPIALGNEAHCVGQRSLLRWATKPIALGNEAVSTHRPMYFITLRITVQS